MLYVLLSVLCSVAVSVIIKLSKKQGVKYLQLMVWNYPLATIATIVFLHPLEKGLRFTALPWGLYAALAILLPGIFLCIAYAIQYSGIAKTEVAQRLSLFIPLLAAFFLFHEKIAFQKLIGIAVGLAAICCSIVWNSKQNKQGKVWYALLVFLGMGIIDILFKQVALYKQIPYAYSMLMIFVVAMFLSFALFCYNLWSKQASLQWRAIFWGILLGFFNFGNILFYMKAHQVLSKSPSIVFTGMNVGVILLGALIGVVCFAEKLSFWNKIGLLLAVISVLMIAYL